MNKLLLATAATLCGSLVLAGPAGAACAVTVSYNDDGSANTSLDLDFGDDYASKRFTSPTTTNFTPGMQVYFTGATAYGGCGDYTLYVDGVSDHSFDTCTPGWQAQPITRKIPGSSITIRVADTDGSFYTGIIFNVDTSRSGASTITQNYSSITGELMWRIGLACT